MPKMKLFAIKYNKLFKAFNNAKGLISIIFLL